MGWLILIAAIHSHGWDQVIAHRFYDSAAGRWTWAQSWWANDLLYHYGNYLVYAVAASTLVVLITGWLSPQRRHWVRPAGYLLLCMGLSTGSVGLLKQATDMDCPRDIAGFGGSLPDIGLFQPRPAGLPGGRCFPGGHSSGGFSLLALYFLLRERGRRPALRGLAFGLVLGSLFALAQWARGSHFPSHDLTSAAVAWLVALSVYTVGYRRRLWRGGPGQTHAPAAD